MCGSPIFAGTAWRAFARTLAAEMMQVAVWRPVRALFSIDLRGSLTGAPLVQPLPLRQSNKGGPR